MSTKTTKPAAAEVADVPGVTRLQAWPKDRSKAADDQPAEVGERHVPQADPDVPGVAQA